MKYFRYIICSVQFVILLLMFFISCKTTSIINEPSTINIEKTMQNFSVNGMIIFEWLQHEILSGETIAMISEKYGISYGTIVAVNKLKNARRIQEGQVLRIPSVDGIIYQMQEGDSLSIISSKYLVPLEVILDVNELNNGNIGIDEIIFLPNARINDIDLRVILRDPFIYPINNREIINRYYGMKKDLNTGVIMFHEGVDFKANVGETVMASMDGVVSLVSENKSYGKYILISHSNGYLTLYAHLNSFTVRERESVKKGQKIGETGNTGNVSEPHLHFGVYNRNNRAINPLEVLN